MVSGFSVIPKKDRALTLLIITFPPPLCCTILSDAPLACALVNPEFEAKDEDTYTTVVDPGGARLLLDADSILADVLEKDVVNRAGAYQAFSMSLSKIFSKPTHQGSERPPSGSFQ